MAIPIKYNLRNLTVRKVSTGMTVLVVCLVVTVFLFVLALWQGVERTLSVTASTRNVLAMRVGSQAEMQSVVTREQFEMIQALPGIERNSRGEPMVSPEILVLINLLRADGQTTNVLVRGLAPIGLEMRPVRIIDGRMFNGGTNEVVVSKNLAHRFASMKIGDTIRTGAYRWIVVGHFDASGSAYESEIWTDSKDLQAQSKRPIFSSIFVRAPDAASAQRFIQAIAGLLSMNALDRARACASPRAASCHPRRILAARTSRSTAGTNRARKPRAMKSSAPAFIAAAAIDSPNTEETMITGRSGQAPLISRRAAGHSREATPSWQMATSQASCFKTRSSASRESTCSAISS